MFLYATGFNTKYGATPCTMSYLTKMFRECELCSYLHLCVHVLFGTLIIYFFFSTSWTCFEKTARDLRRRGDQYRHMPPALGTVAREEMAIVLPN